MQEMVDFIQDEPTLVILGDIYHEGQIELPQDSSNCQVYISKKFPKKRISEFGVINLDENGQILSISEKPTKPEGDYVHMGTTYFPSDLSQVLNRMRNTKGLTLTEVSKEYLKLNRLSPVVCDHSWFNIGTHEDLFSASEARRNRVQNKTN